MSDNKCEKLTQLIKSHVDAKKLNVALDLWRIQESSLGGRGLFANRDIQTGEVIIVDNPIIIGPKSRNDGPIHCVICSKSTDIDVCSKGCGLPVCSENCEESATHQKECELIRKSSIAEDLHEISMELVGGLTPLRAFFLGDNDRQLLNNLVGHMGPHHGSEVDLVQKKIRLKDSDEKFMRKICCILDCNSFETKVLVDDTEVILRALYPICCLLNHSCTPNAAYLFDENQKMILKASQPIQKDSEILIIYVNPLWGTTSRRLKLATSKHFWCECARCKDPTEFGTYLNGVKCSSAECQGVVLPIDPLDNFSEWRCVSCQRLVTRQTVGTVQSTVEELLKKGDASNVGVLIDFIQKRLTKLVPAKNQIAIELKIQVIQTLGHTKKYAWNDGPVIWLIVHGILTVLTLNQLTYKEELCQELLQLMLDLQLGQWKLRGLVLFELYRCQLEKSLRAKSADNLKETEGIEQEGRRILKEAADILANDITAPKEIKRLNVSRNVAKF